MVIGVPFTYFTLYKFATLYNNQYYNGDANGTRIRIMRLKVSYPNQLDDSAIYLVGEDGIEPPTA